MTQEEIDQRAKVIWDYHHMNQQLQKADCIFVLGSHDTRVAEYAADLFLQGFAPWIIFSGGFGRLTEGNSKKSEAEIFADIAMAKGVPADKIILEKKSGNTGDNVRFSRKLLADKGLEPKSLIVAQKPYMERRSFATFRKLWPEADVIVTSPDISYNDYPNAEISREEMIGVMVGDLQRIKLYPERGYQITQEIPDEVWDACEKLVAAGFDSHLIKE